MGLSNIRNPDKALWMFGIFIYQNKILIPKYIKVLIKIDDFSAIRNVYPMKDNLPYLNQERLNIIFEKVYDDVDDIKLIEKDFENEKIYHLLCTLKAMQYFNYRHRPDDTRCLFGVLDPIFNFERNSEGTTLWLSLILAIKELYGFSNTTLMHVMKEVTVRK